MEISLEDMQIYEKETASSIEAFLELESDLEKIIAELPNNYKISCKGYYTDVRYLIFDHLRQNVKFSYVCLKCTYINQDFLKYYNHIELMKNDFRLKVLFYCVPVFYHSIENHFYTLNEAICKIKNLVYTKNRYKDIIFDLFCELDNYQQSKELPNLSFPKDNNLYFFLGYLRNTIHNNWVHTGENIEFEIGETTINLNKNEKVRITGFQLFQLLKKIIGNLRNVMMCDLIKELNEEHCRERFIDSYLEDSRLGNA